MHAPRNQPGTAPWKRSAGTVIALLVIATTGSGQGVSVRELAVSGEGAPGSGGRTFEDFRSVRIDRLGRAAFRAEFSGPDGAGGGIWTADRDGTIAAVAVAGRTVPPFPFFASVVTGAVYDEVGDPAIADDGQVAYWTAFRENGASITPDRTEAVMVTGTEPGTNWVAAWAGIQARTEPAPGGTQTGGSWFNESFAGPLLAADRTVTVRAHLKPSLTSGLEHTLDGIYFTSLGSSGPAPQTTIQPFFAALQGLPAPGAGAGFVFRSLSETTPIGADGACFFAGTASSGSAPGDERHGVWARTAGGQLEPVLLEGATPPGRLAGSTPMRFAGLRVDRSGRLVFWAALRDPQAVDGNASAAGEAIFRWTGSVLVPVVATGDAVPGLPGAAFSSLGDPASSGDGSVAFRAEARLASGETATGIWFHPGPTPGTPRLVALSGSPAPGAGEGAVFASLGTPLVNHAGQLAFAGVAHGSVGSDRVERSGVWAADRGGALGAVAVGGMSLSGSARPVAVPVLADFGDGGDVALILHRDDGSQSVAVATLPDGQPPVLSGGPVLEAANSFSVAITWPAAVDNIGVEYYRVFRDGVVVGEVAAPVSRFFQAGLAQGNTHRYRIEAVDLGGNVSSRSAEVVVEVPRSGTPVVVDNADAGYVEESGSWYSVAGGGGHLGGWRRASATQPSSAGWTASLPLTGRYEVHAWWGSAASLNSTVAYTIEHGEGAETLAVDQSRDGDQWNYLGTWHFDAGDPAVVRVGLPVPGGADICADAVRFVPIFNDRLPPGPPPTLAVEWLDSYSALVRWGAASDDIGVERYAVIRDGVEIAQTAGLEFRDFGLSGGGFHTYQVQAIDYAGRRSPVGGGVPVEMPLPGVQTIVDNADPGYAELRGSWYGVNNGSGYGGSWRRASATVPAEARWRADLALPGIYEVYAWWGESPSLNGSAEFVVDHADGSSSVRMDQRFGGGEWNYVGAFRFDGASPATVRLVGDPPGGADRAADAVRFVHLGVDRFAPSAPSGVQGRWLSPREVVLTWDPSWDDTGVASYSITRDGVQIGISTDPAFVDAGAVAGSDHRYAVLAGDHFGRRSSPSVEFEVRVPTSGAEHTVDSADGGFSVQSGSWALLASGGCFGGSARLTDTGGSARFSPGALGAGHYEVFAYHCSGEQLDAEADYRITHADGTTDLVINQNATRGRWVSLGSYRFGGSVGENVRVISDGSDWRRTCADAVRWVALDTRPMLSGAVQTAVDGNTVTIEGVGVDTLFREGGGILEVRLSSGGTEMIAESVVALGNERFRATFRLPDAVAPRLWRLTALSPLDGSLASGAIVPTGDWLSDRDGDGLSALHEHAFGGREGRADGDRLPVVLRAPDGGRLVRFHQRRPTSGPDGPAGGETGANRVVDGLIYSVELSTDLGTWLDGGAFLEPEGQPIDLGDGTERVTLRIDPALERLGDGIFCRLRVAFADR